jgi:hypothetical protein
MLKIIITGNMSALKYKLKSLHGAFYNNGGTGSNVSVEIP